MLLPAFVAAALFALNGCATSQINHSIRSIEGPNWLAIEIDGMKVRTIHREPFSMRFEGGRVVGSAGCNSYAASYVLDRQRIHFAGVTTTRVLCAPEVMELSRRFFKVLGRPARYKFAARDWHMVLMNDRGDSIIFVPAEAAAVPAA
jgi:heat shock protein HslJ